MIDLTSPGTTKALAKRISDDIDECCVEMYDDGHRNHLGASLIGHECKRYLWYTFRWVLHETCTGRLYRLFNRGHKEEDRFIEWMKGIGIEVWADDLENNKLMHSLQDGSYFILTRAEFERPTFENVYCDSDDVSDSEFHIARAKADGLSFPQYRISDVFGHFGGSLDGICKLPERFQYSKPLLQEFKTSNTNGFNKLKKKGVILAKPQHYSQMCTYGNKYKLEYGLYMCVCKETDEIYYEIVKLDWNQGEQMVMKAENIICAKEAPPKMSQSETFYNPNSGSGCKFCNFSDICHKGAIAEVNCRSCVKAVAAEKGEWICTKWDTVIPREAILKTAKDCNEYKSILDKV